jgi:hypothetical protein
MSASTGYETLEIMGFERAESGAAPTGMSVLFNFTQANQSANGVYTVSDTGANDPGGHPAVFTRRADFDASGDILVGATFPVTQDDSGGEPGGLYRLQGDGPFTLDASNLIFIEQRFATPTTIQTTTTNAGSADGYIIFADATGGAINVNLPGAANSRGPISAKKIDAGVNTVTLTPDSVSETIDGATTKVLSTQYQSVTLYSDGSRWWVVG